MPDAPPDEGDTTPSWLTTTEMRRYARPALAALWRHGLLAGVWIERLRGAGTQLANFVNRFYQVPGFVWVVRLYFGGPYRRALARLAMALAARLAERDPQFVRTASFEQAIGLLPTGEPLLAVELHYRTRRYILLPWARPYRRALYRQLLRSAALHPLPERVRWVFRRGIVSRAEIVRSVRGVLSRRRPREEPPGLRAWLDRLDRVVRFV